MKKLAIILIIVAATAMIFSSCGKYEEGPSFTVLTKKARVTGTWTTTEFIFDGETISAEDFFTGLFEIFGVEVSEFKQTTTLEKDGTGTTTDSYILATILVTETSNVEWEFDDTKEALRMRTQDSETDVWGVWSESKITKLTNSELWTEETETIQTADGDVEYITVVKMTKE
jgi:hypothetical protein